MKILLNLIFPVLVDLCMVVIFTGCAVIDPRFSALEPYIETNPSPTAIVGMWHTKTSLGPRSLLFRADGSLLHKDKAGAIDLALQESKYRYAGDGVWIVEGADYKYRIVKGHLIYFWDSPQATSRLVYDRQ